MRHSINGKTSVFGIIGWPVEHSLSPAIHNEAFRFTGVDAVYVPWAVRPEHLPEAIAGLRTLGVKGFNVTVPHKERIIGSIDGLEGDARLIGAVNTVTLTGGNLIGFNTDSAGFTGALEVLAGSRQIRSCIMFGCGGAARAVLLGLLKRGVKRIFLTDIDFSRARKLILEPWVADNDTTGGPAVIDPGDPELEQTVRDVELVINATPVGMSDSDSPLFPGEWMSNNQVVVDLVYGPGETRLIKEARRCGALAMDGRGMLVEQAALAFEIWQDRPAPREVMYEVVEETRRGKAS